MKINQFLVVLSVIFVSHLANASEGTRYQVDLVIFSQPNSGVPITENLRSDDYIPQNQSAIPLQYATDESIYPYYLVPSNQSHLNTAIANLKRNHYQVITQYSWIQPSDANKAISFPQKQFGDWKIDGNLQIKQQYFYQLKGALLIESPSTPDAFTFHFAQQLKSNTTYYIDHPYIGMLINIHQVKA